ncbi:MFS transporter [Microbacterium foliorum]|nr:MFS transporter [Microbacterium foliorum]
MMSGSSVLRMPDTSTIDQPTTRTSRTVLSLAFVIGAFALGTSENVIAGILPELSSSLEVTEGTGGMLVTAYAATVVVAGPILTLVVDRLNPRKVLIGSLGLYLAGSVLAAISSTYAIMFASRVITGLVHTTIMVVFMTTAMRIAPVDRQASAAARITLGLSVATVLGVPIGVAISQAFDWRLSFVFIALLTAFSLVVMLRAFPRSQMASEIPERAESLRALGRPKVVLGVVTTALAAMAALTLVVYIAPFLTTSVGFPTWSITWVMFAYGVGSIIGNTVGGAVANKNVAYALFGTVSATLVALIGLALFPAHGYVTVASIIFLGFAYFSTFPALNTWIAQSSRDVSPNLALAVNSSAFNVGIALAGVLGGIYTNGGNALSGLPIVAAIPAALAVCAALGVVAAYRKTRTR